MRVEGGNVIVEVADHAGARFGTVTDYSSPLQSEQRAETASAVIDIAVHPAMAKADVIRNYLKEPWRRRGLFAR